MPDLEPRPAGLASRAAIRARVVLTGLLVVLVIGGVRSIPALGWQQSWAGPWHDHGTAVLIGLEVMLAGLLVALGLLRRGRPSPGWPAARLRTWLGFVIPCLMAGCGLAFLRKLPTGKPRPRPTQPSGPQKIGLGRKPPRQGRPFVVPHAAVTAIEYALLTLVVVAIIVAIVVLLSRRRAPVDAELVLPPDETSLVRDAVEAGRRALTGISDARLAIIACYLAMERSLARAGAARGAAETPDELLARSTAAGLLHGSPATRLTALFYEARFSGHEVRQAARSEALTALESILADLGDTSEADAAGQAGLAVTP